MISESILNMLAQDDPTLKGLFVRINSSEDIQQLMDALCNNSHLEKLYLGGYVAEDHVETIKGSIEMLSVAYIDIHSDLIDKENLKSINEELKSLLLSKNAEDLGFDALSLKK